MAKKCMILLTLVYVVFDTDSVAAFNESLQGTVFQEIVATYSSNQAKIYVALETRDKAAFLTSFWSRHNPLVLKYYHNVLVGKKYVSVDESFWDQIRLIPKVYKVEVVPVDSSLVADAIEVCEKLNKMMPDDPIVLNALGYLMLEQRDGVTADAYFLKALQKDKRLVAARQGRGLAHLLMPLKAWEAKRFFEDALPWDRKYAAAFYNQAMCHVALRMVDTEIHFKRLLKRFHNHAQGHFKYGVFLELRGKLDKAEEMYQKQLAIQKAHPRAGLRLGLIAFKRGDYPDAIAVLNQYLDLNPGLKQSLLPILFDAHLELGDIVGADTTAMAYLNAMEETQKALFEDIQFVASPEELEVYEALAEDEQGDYIRAFWQQRDPTPATPENEWLIEHIRRVIYSRRHFFASNKPWDRRGEVYIRYGAPAHWSRSDDVRYEVDPGAVRVKDRLWDQLTMETRIEIVARFQRLRTSDKDGIYYPGGAKRPDLFDFEGVEHGSRVTRNNPVSSEKKFQSATSVSQRDEGLGADQQRGYPAFPVLSGKAWEYWIYPEISGGIELVFTSDTASGDFDFPELPMTRREERKMMVEMMRYRPEEIIASAISQSPTLFRFEYEPFTFSFASAAFKGDEGKSRLEVYYGVDEKVQLDSLALGLAVFDSVWNPVIQRVEDWKGQTLAQANAYVDEQAVDLAPGKYFMGVQMKQGRKFSSYKKERMVDDYYTSKLTLSDIELAAEIVPGEGSPVKDGLQVVALPGRALAKDQPLKVYYELYGLTRNDFGQTRYRVDYLLLSVTGETPIVKVLRAIGKPLGLTQDESFSVAYEQAGDSEIAKQYIEIDVSASPAGSYRLAVTVTDLETRQRAVKEVGFQILADTVAP